MAYWIQAKVKGGAFSIVVTSAREALAKLEEFSELGDAEATAHDLLGHAVEVGTLRFEAEQSQ